MAGAGPGEIMDQLAAITEAQSVSDTVRGYMLTAFGKLASQSGAPLTPAAQELVHSAAASANPDLQQRALELQALVRCLLPLPSSATPLTARPLLRPRPAQIGLVARELASAKRPPGRQRGEPRSSSQASVALGMRADAGSCADTRLHQSPQQHQRASGSGEVQQGGLCSKSATSVRAEHRSDWRHAA